MYSPAGLSHCRSCMWIDASLFSCSRCCRRGDHWLWRIPELPHLLCNQCRSHAHRGHRCTSAGPTTWPCQSPTGISISLAGNSVLHLVVETFLVSFNWGAYTERKVKTALLMRMGILSEMHWTSIILSAQMSSNSIYQLLQIPTLIHRRRNYHHRFLDPKSKSLVIFLFHRSYACIRMNHVSGHQLLVS